MATPEPFQQRNLIARTRRHQLARAFHVRIDPCRWSKPIGLKIALAEWAQRPHPGHRSLSPVHHLETSQCCTNICMPLRPLLNDASLNEGFGIRSFPLWSESCEGQLPLSSFSLRCFLTYFLSSDCLRSLTAGMTIGRLPDFCIYSLQSLRSCWSAWLDNNGEQKCTPYDALDWVCTVTSWFLLFPASNGDIGFCPGIGSVL